MPFRSPWLLGAAWVSSCSLLLDFEGRKAERVGDEGSPPVDAAAEAPSSAVPDGKACPERRPPSLVYVAGSCVDATEVTNAEYASFLASSPDPGGQPARCAWNTTFVPGDWPVTADEKEWPVTEVDWCDAHAYCLWAGKRLCGEGDVTAPRSGTWFAACSNGGRTEYPYGDAFQPTSCRSSEIPGTEDPGPVATMPSCQGGPAGIYDMSGNAAEWEDACEEGSPDAAVPRCRVRGGSYRDTMEGLSCDSFELETLSAQHGDLGFRCCADLAP